MDNSNEVILKVDNLCQYFKMGRGYLKAVDHVSFEIKRGEVFGLVGESGCGKTTTGRTIIKLYDATGGNVYFGGRRIVAGTLQYKEEIKRLAAELKEFAKKEGVTPEELEKKKAEINGKIAEQRALKKAAEFDHRNCDKVYRNEQMQRVHDSYAGQIEAASSEEQKVELIRKRDQELALAKRQRYVTKIQMIFQDPIASLDPRMTVREIISEGLVISGVKDKDYINDRVYDMLEKVGLVAEHANRYPHEFSGGQRQRIGVARSIIMNPDLIIADEPVSALDVSIQAQVINLLNDLRNELGLTILFIAHDLSVIKYFSDRIGVMYFGKMVELASSDELFKNPCHPYTKALLSSIPLPDPDYEKKRKRIMYNPLRDHDYREEQPTFREVHPGHFVMCNSVEYDRIVKELKD